MVRLKNGRRWSAAVAVAGLLGGSAVGARAFPFQPQGAVGGSGVLEGAQAARPQRFAQNFFKSPGQGFGQQQFGQQLGQGRFPGGGLGQGQRQGGGFPGGGLFSLAPGGTVQLAAVCTDLLSEPPDAATRFTGGDQARVALADGQTITLAKAIQAGMVAVRGRSDSFDPLRRDGSLLLDLYLANTSRAPVQVAMQPGTTITPAGQAAQTIPKGADRLFALAAQQRLSYTNTMQFAVWAARGSTAEEVEQTNMTVLPAGEVTCVQGLLDGSGVRRQFDRERGAYLAKYKATAERLGEDTAEVKGYTFLAGGKKAAIEGVRPAEGRGLVTIRPVRGGEFYYGAEFKKRTDGKVGVTLYHLVTGKPARVNRGGFVLYPDRT